EQRPERVLPHARACAQGERQAEEAQGPSGVAGILASGLVQPSEPYTLQSPEVPASRPGVESTAWIPWGTTLNTCPVPGGGALRVLGIDPGSRFMGYGVVEERGGQLQHVAHGVIRAGEGALELRLRRIGEALRLA